MQTSILTEMRELRHYEQAEPDLTTPTVNDLKHLSPTTSFRGRERWIDIAKGVAILLMVFGHIWGGLMTSKVLELSAFNQGLYTWIYTFHMPAFVFMAGLFLGKSVERGLWKFALNRLSTLYYPAVLWGLITWAAMWQFRAYINSDPGRRPVWNLFYHPDSSYGFLLILLELSLLWALARTLRTPAWVLPWVAAGLLACGLWTDAGIIIDFGAYGLWLSSAAALQLRVLGAAKLSGAWLASIATAGFAVVTAGTLFMPIDSTAGHLACTPAGIAMLLAFAVLLDRTPIAAVLARCGTCSLEIYLMHSLIWVACRIVLLRFLHVSQPVILVPVLVLCGTAGSIAAARLAEHLNMPWAFRFRQQ